MGRGMSCLGLVLLAGFAGSPWVYATVTPHESTTTPPKAASAAFQRFAYQADVTMSDGRVRSFSGNSPLLDGMKAAASKDGMGLSLVPHRMADGKWEFQVEITDGPSKEVLQKNVLVTNLSMPVTIQTSTQGQEAQNRKVASAVMVRVTFPRAE